jgi:hypothetical protein
LYKSKLTQYLTVKLNFTEVFARGHITSHPQINRLQNSDSPILAWHLWQALTPVGFGFGFFFSVRLPAAPPHTFSNFSDHLPPPPSFESSPCPHTFPFHAYLFSAAKPLYYSTVHLPALPDWHHITPADPFKLVRDQ